MSEKMIALAIFGTVAVFGLIFGWPGVVTVMVIFMFLVML